MGTADSSSAIRPAVLRPPAQPVKRYDAPVRSRPVYLPSHMTQALCHTVAAGREHLPCDVRQVAQGEIGRTRWSRSAGRRALHELAGSDPLPTGFSSAVLAWWGWAWR
jgi:hypothetical protein